MTAILETVLAALANSLWLAGAAVFLAWAGLRYAPRMNAATRHLVWWAVLGTILAMPAAPWLAGTLKPRREIRPVLEPIPVAQVVPAAVPAFTPQAETPALTTRVALHAGSWPVRVFFVWLAVFLLQMARIAWSYLYLRGVKRRAQRAVPEMRRDFDVWMLACGVHRPAQLLISREIESPMAVGFRTPAVIVPEALLDEFSECEFDHVLLHELAHIARRDDWSNLAARIGWAFLALHPAAAWVLRQIEREREIACDDWVVAATGQARPYAASLARLFEVCFTRRRALLATGMAERASQLGDRIEMLLRRGRQFTSRTSPGRVAFCSGVLLLLLAVGSRAPRWIAFAQEPAPAAPAAPAALAEPSELAAPAAPAAAPASSAPAAAPAPPVQEAKPAPQAAPAAPSAPAAPAPPRNGSFLSALVAAGYGNLPVDDIIALKQSGVTAEFITGMNQSGWSKLAPQDLINLRNHGVSTDYLRSMHELGLDKLAVKDVIDLREHGVNAAYLKDIQSAGLGTYGVREVIDFRQHGVNPELLRALKDEGYHNMEARDIIELRDNGVEMRNLREARQYGSSLTVRQIIRLKQAGVI